LIAHGEVESLEGAAIRLQKYEATLPGDIDRRGEVRRIGDGGGADDDLTG
jgi:hypothetical protein